VPNTEERIRAAAIALHQGHWVRSNGKKTVGNVAIEAQVARATFYRELKRNVVLSEFVRKMLSTATAADDDELGGTGSSRSLADKIPTVLLRKKLRESEAALAQAERDHKVQEKVRAHQLLVLWAEIDRLKARLVKLGAKSSLQSLRPIN
jgi:hypothetical protein